jgi:micrococcal nuclease
VVDVVDGDTVKVDGPSGLLTVRLIGINTPERGECLFDAASAEMARTVAGHSVQLVTDTSESDQYGRALRYIELDDGVDVGAHLVSSGLALSRHYLPDTSRSDGYDRLQANAKDAGLGLWAADACGPVSTGVSIAIGQHANAAGDDNTNLNDEWVSFTNRGPMPIDLDGWVVADESASHRYMFRNLVLAAGAAVTLFTGCGADTLSGRYWCNTTSAVWNNAGDTVFLHDPAGNIAVALKY